MRARPGGGSVGGRCPRSPAARSAHAPLPCLAAAPLAAAPAAAHTSSAAPELPARWRELRALPTRRTAEAVALTEAAEAARVDPSALVMHLAPQVAVPPPDGVCQGACSPTRGATVGGAAKLGALQQMARMANAMNTAPAMQRARAFDAARGARVGTVSTQTRVALTGRGGAVAVRVVPWGANPTRANARRPEGAELGPGSMTTMELR